MDRSGSHVHEANAYKGKCEMDGFVFGECEKYVTFILFITIAASNLFQCSDVDKLQVINASDDKQH